jgi:Ran GTPase-activating protein (RanGAP) involved in mRNA processing and transport
LFLQLCSLEGLTHLESLGLSDNRLTEVSLPTIIKHANFSSLMHLDLSFNDMHDQGAKAIAHHFRHPGNVLHYLDLCNCNLNCSDIAVICANLKAYANQLEEMHLSSNKIAGSGASEICGFLSSSMCKLENLDMSWNTVGDVGAIEFAQILGKDNRSLIRLNLSANAISDHGGQRFMDSVGFNTSLKEISLCQNNLSDRTCFVVAQVLSSPSFLTIFTVCIELNCVGFAESPLYE